MVRVRFTAIAIVMFCVLAACSSQPQNKYSLTAVPATDTFCLAAQRVVVRTTLPMDLTVHEDFEGFVKSKTEIVGPMIHQYNWYGDDGSIVGISCKMKSADDLNRFYGEGTAGPEGYCQDMNRQVYEVLGEAGNEDVYAAVEFDLSESLDTPEQRGMIGPAWLMPFTMTYVDDDNRLHVATKGFTIRYDDPRYQKFPENWRGTHYCHLMAPDYFARLLSGAAPADVTVGRKPPVRR